MNIGVKEDRITEGTPEPEIQPKTFGGILQNLFIIYGKGFLKLAVPVGIVEGILIGIALWLQHSRFHVYTEWAAFGVLIVTYLVYSVLYVLVDGILISTVASYNLSGKSSIRNSILILWHRLGRLYGALGLFSLFWLAFGILFFLLSVMYIPGLVLFAIAILPVFIYLMVKWRFVFEAVMIEGRGPGEAFTRSSRLVEGYWWRTFGIILVIGIISGGIGYGLVYAFKFLGVYAQLIATVIAAPIGVIGNTLLYYDLRARSEHCSIKESVEELTPTKNPIT